MLLKNKVSTFGSRESELRLTTEVLSVSLSLRGDSGSTLRGSSLWQTRFRRLQWPQIGYSASHFFLLCRQVRHPSRSRVVPDFLVGFEGGDVDMLGATGIDGPTLGHSLRKCLFVKEGQWRPLGSIYSDEVELSMGCRYQKDTRRVVLGFLLNPDHASTRTSI
jgi:hypothetical protein